MSRGSFWESLEQLRHFAWVYEQLAWRLTVTPRGQGGTWACGGRHSALASRPQPSAPHHTLRARLWPV